MFCSGMLCHALFCHAMLRYALSCYAMMCYALLNSVMLVEGAGGGTLRDSRDNLGSGGRGMQGGAVAGGSVLRNLTTPTCRVGKNN